MPERKQAIIRTRAVLTCLHCKNSKIKCDKARPRCSRCVDRDQDCHYDQEVKRGREQEKSPTPIAPKDDTVRLTSPTQAALLPPNCADCHCRTSLEAQTHPVTLKPRTRNRIPKACNRCRKLKVRCDQQEPCRRCIQQMRDKECVYGVQRPSFQKVAGERATFYAISHWRTVSSNIEAVLAHSICPGICYTTNSMEIELPLGKSSFGMLMTSSTTPTASRKKVLAAIPGTAQASELCKAYLATVNKVYNILHEESFVQELATYSRDPASANLGWLALLCAVISQGMLLRQTSKGETPNTTDSLGRDEAERLLETAQSCVAHTAFMARPTIAAVQCLCIIAVSHQLTPFSCHDTDSSWVLTGLILKLAYSLSLHDCKNIPDLSESERAKCEILWQAIVHLELRQSLTSGKPTMLRLQDLVSLQQVDGSCDNAGWVSALPVIAGILDEKHSTRPKALSRTAIAQYDFELRRLLWRADECDVTSTTVGIQHHQHIALTIFIRRTRLALHYPEFCQPDAFLHYPEGYWASLECCLGLLALQRMLDECCQPHNCSWLAELFKEDFYTAALTLCQYLLQDGNPMRLAAPPLQADTEVRNGLQIHPRETVMETLRSCRDIWDRKKALSFCQSMAYKAFNAVLKKIEEGETTSPAMSSQQQNLRLDREGLTRK